MPAGIKERAIVTGFKPFDPYQFNPTQDLAQEIDGQNFDGVEVTGLVLPSNYYRAFDLLSERIDATSPSIVLSMGLSSSVLGVRLESVGRNIMNGKYPDDEGRKPDNEPILADGAPFYRVNSDTIRLAHELHLAEVPSEVSVDATGFTCNSLLYLTARRIELEQLPISHAFFHTSWTTDYADKVELAAGKITISKDNLRTAIAITLQNLRHQEKVSRPELLAAVRHLQGIMPIPYDLQLKSDLLKCGSGQNVRAIPGEISDMARAVVGYRRLNGWPSLLADNSGNSEQTEKGL